MGGVLEQAWRTDEFGAAPRPEAIAALPLPPAKLKLLDHGVMRKQWRYVGIYGPEVMICAAVVTVGPATQTFWAIWDRETQTLHDRTHNRNTAVKSPDGKLVIRDKGVSVELDIEQVPGMEVVTPTDSSWFWTRKQLGVRAQGTVKLGDREIKVDSLGMIDDSAGYHARQTLWRWSTGVGKDVQGRDVAWNFVNGMHDHAGANENGIWVGDEVTAFPSAPIAEDLSAITIGADTLNFHQESERGAKSNLILIRSEYRQPFGTFTGSLPGVGEIHDAFGVMEFHDVVW